MSSFQRMIAIPQEEYLSLSAIQNVQAPLSQHFYDLENRYNKEENESDAYRRMIMQSNTLNQMKKVKEEMRNSLAISTPKPYQSRANALFQNVESFLKFNEKGEIYSDDGALIDGSRLEDLIQHAVRDRRRNMMPTGWSDFLTILRNHNVPKSILNRDTLDEMARPVSSPRPTALSPLITIKEEPTKQKSPSPPRDDGRRSRARTKAPLKAPVKASVKAPVKAKPQRVHFLRNFKNE